MIIIFFSFWFVRLDADGFAIRLVVLFLFCSFSSLFPSAFYILGGGGGEGRGGESRKRGGEGRGGRGEGRKRGGEEEGRGKGTQLGSFQATSLAWLDPGLCKKNPKIGNCNFPRVFFILLSFVYHFFIMFHHFCFQWCKNSAKNGKLQFSSIFFHFLSFFFSCFIIFASSGAKIFPKNGKLQFSSRFFHFLSLFYNVSSFLLPVVQKFSKNGKNAIFLEFFFHFLSVFYHFSSFLFPVEQKFCEKWKIAIFLEFFSFCYHLFIIFLSFFIIFASSGAKILQKMENCNFPRVFYFFIMFHHFCFQWCKNSAKSGKLQFSSSFCSFFYHVSSFLLPVVQKFCQKKWKIVIFLGFFSFFYHFFIMFHHFCFQWCKNFQKNGKLQFASGFSFFYHFFTFFYIFLSSFVYHVSSFLLPVVQNFSQKTENCNFPRVFSFFDHFSSFLFPVVQKFSKKKGKLQFPSFFFPCF